MLEGPDGVFTAMQPGTIIIDMSSIAPATARRLATKARALGGGMLDAPVSGGDIGAIQGTLSIMVGGDAADFIAVKPILDVMGNPEKVVHIGDSGAGQLCKLCNQMVIGGTLAAVAEALALVRLGSADPPARLEAARALGGRRYGVRRHTSEMLVDRAVLPQMGRFRPTGVNPQLVWNVRRALDAEGFRDVRIIVSGGFTVEKIEMFEREGVPVDAYGVGSSLFQGRFDFTADVVQHEGKPCAKVGREYRPNPRLELVE